MKDFLICYDITDPGRLNSVARYLTKSSLRLQKSIFVYKGPLALFNEQIRNVLTKLDKSEDDFRVYEIKRKKSVHLGIPTMGEGIWVDL